MLGFDCVGWINPLRYTGYFIHQKLPYSVHRVFLGLSWVSNEITIVPVHGINWLLAIMQEGHFYCEVGIASLNVIQGTFRH
jgi:hypothetical protein